MAGYWQQSRLGKWADRGSSCCVYLRDLLLSLLLVAALSPCDSLAQAEPEEDSGPLLISLSPLTAQRGSTLKVEARGSRLEGVYAVWIDQGGFKGRVLGVEEINDPVRQGTNPPEKQKKSGALYRALVELEIHPATRAGVHLLRLVSRRGISNPIAFPVVDSPVTVEAAGSHQTVKESQPAALPGFISGRIGEPGEVDYYAFLARKGQRLRFEAVERQKFDPEATAGKFAPELALYRPGGSWFDPQRPTRLLFEEERSSDLMHVDSEGTYQFSEDGRYFLQVSGLFGQGCPDCTYQVRVVSCDQPGGLTDRNGVSSPEWFERSLSRSLTDNWIGKLESRSVKISGGAPAKEAPSSETTGVHSVKPEAKQIEPPGPPLAFVEHEPNESASQAASIPVPALIEGTIEHPGDVDSFKFQAEPGQKLAFEVETPEAKPPYFNPRLGVVDSQDHELLSNVERRLSMFNNNADPQVYLKAVRPKAIYSFERQGEYFLQIRDITSRYGNPSYRYRILVRPQIPHVGEISVTARDSSDGNPDAPKPIQISRLNLVRGAPKKLILTASYEEGFSGDLSFFFTGLPDGVEPFPAVQFNEGRAPLEVTQNPDAIAPKQQKTAIVLLARPEAPLTTEPRTVQLRCQLITNGKLGPSLLVREIPLMVVEGSAPGEGEKPGK